MTDCQVLLRTLVRQLYPLEELAPNCCGHIHSRLPWG